MENYKRPDWDEYFLNIAQEVGKRSTCLRRRYGAIIVKDKIIVSTGYNGAPRGEENCIDTGICERERLQIPKGERYELCVAGDSVIKLLDGTYRTIRELAEIGQPFWTYAVDTKTGCIVPAQAENPRKTGVRNDIVRITFDNGKSITCTADHKILLTDCTYKAASDLKIQDSVMPLYYNFALNDGYESICNTLSRRRGRLTEGNKCGTFQIPTHHLVYQFFNGAVDFGNGKFLIHHKDGNKLNNIPDNLECVNFNGNFGFESVNFNHRYLQYQGRIVKGISLLIGKMAEVHDETAISIETYPALQKKYRPVGGRRGTMETIPWLKTILKWFDGDFDRAMQAARVFNHRVIKIEKITEPIEVYDVTVPEFHNFPVDLGDNSCVFVHNCRSVHAEQNAIINGDPLKMKDATIYIVGINAADGSYASGEPCLLCRRMIKNAQITKVICRNKDGEIAEVNL